MWKNLSRRDKGWLAAQHLFFLKINIIENHKNNNVCGVDGGAGMEREREEGKEPNEGRPGVGEGGCVCFFFLLYF